MSDTELIAVDLTAESLSINSEYQLDLFTSNNIRLEIPMRVNQHDYEKQSYLFRKTQKHIETLFSQFIYIPLQSLKPLDVYS